MVKVLEQSGLQNPPDLSGLISRLTAAETAIGTKAASVAVAASMTALADRTTAVENIVAQVPQFVSSSIMPWAQVLANYPAGAAYRGKYVRISNYGGFVDRVLRCDYDSDLNYHFWTATSYAYGRSVTLSANMSMPAIVSPTSVVLKGSIALGVNRTVTIETLNRAPGDIVEVKVDPTFSLLGSLNILGTGLGSGIGILAGNYQKYLVDGAGGSLALVRLV